MYKHGMTRRPLKVTFLLTSISFITVNRVLINTSNLTLSLPILKLDESLVDRSGVKLRI